ncbi:MAG: response regulator [Desulfobacterales bacterium]|jgi:DNA-binding response OmpR family regulator
MGTILIIEDERGLLEIIREFLTLFGHRVDTASDGHEGIQKFDRNSFDLVITDVCMPGADGNTVVQHIRNSRKKSTPVIGMSGTPWLLENHDFDMVLQKPFPLQTLIDSVKLLPRLAATA